MIEANLIEASHSATRLEKLALSSAHPAISQVANSRSPKSLSSRARWSRRMKWYCHRKIAGIKTLPGLTPASNGVDLYFRHATKHFTGRSDNLQSAVLACHPALIERAHEAKLAGAVPR